MSTTEPIKRNGFTQKIFAPVDVASVVFFRILFGGIMVWWASTYLLNGWVFDYYIAPGFWFSYPGFEWITPWPGEGMFWHFGVLLVLSIFLVLGLFYRVTTVLLFFVYIYIFLLDQAHYLNHHYLVALYTFILIWIPAHRGFSLDALMRPKLRIQITPAWSVWLIRFQMGVVYFFGGISKINPDWLQGEPMRMILGDRTSFPIIGQWFTEEWMVMVFTYGGMVFDLSIVFLLLWKPTRWFGFAWALAFHLLNANLFNIHIFPWFSLGATLMYFAPSWPRDVLRLLKIKFSKVESVPHSQFSPSAIQWAGLVVLGAFVLIQLLLPFRHHLYAGDVRWTGEGDKYSWDMIVHNKEGFGDMRVNDADAHLEMRKLMRQLNQLQVSFMLSDPHMLQQFAHFVGESLKEVGYEDGVRVNVTVSLNGRDPEPIVDPNVNLDQEPLNVVPAPWILPFTEPLPKPEERPKRYWLGGKLHSTHRPGIKVNVDGEFKLLQDLRYSLGQSQNIDGYVFTSMAGDRLKKLLVVQFEGWINPDGAKYNEPSTPLIDVDGWNVHHGGSFASASVLSEQDPVQLVLSQFDIPFWENFSIQRFEFHADDTRRDRVVISYFEDVADSGHSVSELEANNRALWHESVSNEVRQRALSSFKLEQR